MDLGVAKYRLVVPVILAMTMLLLSLPDSTDAYPTGPPVSGTQSLCSDMTPQHADNDAQSSSPPYTITTPAACYTSQQVISGI